jgi:hypothetical protein
MTTVQDLLTLTAVGILLIALTQYVKEKEYFEAATTDTKPSDTKPSEKKCEACPGCGLWTYIGTFGIIVFLLYILSRLASSSLFQTFFMFQMIRSIFRA